MFGSKKSEPVKTMATPSAKNVSYSTTIVTKCTEIKAMVHSKHAEMLQASCDTCEINKPSFFTILEIRNWLMFSITVENFNRAGVCSNMTMQGKHSIID